jgi:hypothetical protein
MVCKKTNAMGAIGGQELLTLPGDMSSIPFLMGFVLLNAEFSV